MRRHTPTLYAHPELDADDPGQEVEWAVPSAMSYPSPPAMNSTSSINGSRAKSRKKSFPASPQLPTMSNSFSVSTPKYPDIYSQFVKRYRSSEPGDDPRNDPDSHYFHQSLGQLVDAGDSDDEDLSRLSLAAGTDGFERIALMLESEPMEPASEKEKDRLNWQIYLASVLGGDVLKSEKSRIAVALEISADEQNTVPLNIWLGIRAKFHGRSEEEEKKYLEERRLRVVDAIIEDINNFRVVAETEEIDTTAALEQVSALLRRLDIAHSLYPSLRTFYGDKPSVVEGPFQARCDALTTWYTVLTTLRHEISVLQKWTGSQSLDVTQPNTSAEQPIGTFPGRFMQRGPADIADGTSFVERVLKEESMQRMFEKGSLVTSHSFIGAARDAQVNLATLFEEMNLPSFEQELAPLISFPTKLAQASLKVRLDYVQKLKDPEVLIIDQMTEDLKIGIGLACTLKRQYEAFLTPDPAGKWKVPQCISDDYDTTILEAMMLFFRLIHWKLKGGAKGIYFKETDVLEAQWQTMNDVSMTVSGGSCLVAEQLW